MKAITFKDSKIEDVMNDLKAKELIDKELESFGKDKNRVCQHLKQKDKDVVWTAEIKPVNAAPTEFTINNEQAAGLRANAK